MCDAVDLECSHLFDYGDPGRRENNGRYVSRTLMVIDF